MAEDGLIRGKIEGFGRIVMAPHPNFVRTYFFFLNIRRNTCGAFEAVELTQFRLPDTLSAASTVFRIGLIHH